MTKINWNNAFLQRDSEGNLTKLAQALDCIIGTGCDCGTDEPGSCIGCLCEAALHEQFDQLVVACKNIGYDLTCGQCAAVFYTGWGNYPHSENCSTVALQNDQITALRAEVQELRSINQELTFEQLANGTS